MTKEELLQLITKGETEQVEFKKSANAIPNSIWETYSAFANTDGGTIVLSEHAGSGLHAIYYTWQQYQLATPIIEQYLNPDRVSFILNWNDVEKSSEKNQNSSEKTTKSSEKTKDKIVVAIKKNKYITIFELASIIGVSTRAIEKQIENLKLAKILHRIGGDKGGHWEVNE